INSPGGPSSASRIRSNPTRLGKKPKENPATRVAGFLESTRERVASRVERGSAALGRLGGGLDDLLGFGLHLGGGGFDLRLGDAGDGFVGLHGAAKHFLAG